MTRLPLPSSTKKPKDTERDAEAQFEFSSREVKPAALLLQDLLRAHSIFLLHHDSSLSSLFLRIKRTKFTSTLSRYWDLYLSTWNVLMHGNPVRDVFGGARIAASGELGIGVGEEERGSGEREVLEGLNGRIDGLVDLVVSKFGDCDPEDIDKAGENKKQHQALSQEQWLGTGREPGAEDGAIFLGVGALSRKSVRDITYWMEDMYRWGENAYGVVESPKSLRLASTALKTGSRRKSNPPAMPIPPSLFDRNRGSKPSGNTPSQGTAGAGRGARAEGEEEAGGLEKYMDYLKLGYGKYWSLGGESASRETSPARVDDSTPVRSSSESRTSKGDDTAGRFLIGLTSTVQDDWIEDPKERRYLVQHEDLNARTIVRTLSVELEKPVSDRPEQMFTRVFGSHDNDISSQGRPSRRGSFDSQDRNKTERLRVVVYVAKPFVFTFLFEVRTESLAFEGLYRSLHHQLAPLRKPLARTATYRPDRPDAGQSTAAIYDLVWDPKALTVHSTIPNIPDPSDLFNIHEQPFWSRVEALNTHMQILNLWKATRPSITELERTCKTSRGWWIVWSRILKRKGDDSSSSLTVTEPERWGSMMGESSSKSSSSQNPAAESDETLPSSMSRMSETLRGSEDEVSNEIFLIRKASDHAAHGRSVSLAGTPSGAGWADGASRLAQGIGVDTRKYIEGLLSHNR